MDIELELERVHLDHRVQLPKQRHAAHGIAQQALILTALDVAKALRVVT